jgi:hypothetical protein
LKLRILALLLGASLAVGGCTAALPSTTTSPASSALASLAVGDCTSALNVQSAPALTVIDCAKEHYWEVAALLPVTGDAYPGEPALHQLADQECASAFATYVGVEPGYSPFGATFLAPAAAHWSQVANRQVACLVGSAAGGLSGSLAQTGLVFPAKGQCTGRPVSGSFALKLIDCAAGHYFEVYATKKWTGKKYPSSAEFDKLYNSVCVTGFRTFVGLSVGKSKFEISASLVPEELWTKLTDHRIVCSAGSPNSEVTGSLKDRKQ